MENGIKMTGTAMNQMASLPPEALRTLARRPVPRMGGELRDRFAEWDQDLLRQELEAERAARHKNGGPLDRTEAASQNALDPLRAPAAKVTRKRYRQRFALTRPMLEILAAASKTTPELQVILGLNKKLAQSRANGLRRNGLIEGELLRKGGAYRWEITDAGRAVLEDPK